MYFDPNTLKALIDANLTPKDLLVLSSIMAKNSGQKDCDLASSLGMTRGNFSRSRKKVAKFCSRPLALDLCCGSGMWEDHKDHLVIHCDNRQGVFTVIDQGRERKIRIEPDILCDFRKLPFPDALFDLVLFDPPHLLNVGSTSWLGKKYGRLESVDDVVQGWLEGWRVLRTGGSLFFKWSDGQIPIADILLSLPVRPLVGDRRPANRSGHTWWNVFFKA